MRVKWCSVIDTILIWLLCLFVAKNSITVYLIAEK